MTVKQTTGNYASPRVAAPGGERVFRREKDVGRQRGRDGGWGGKVGKRERGNRDRMR